MKAVWWALLLTALTIPGAGKKNKGPEIQILEVSAKRGEGLISIDSRLRNVGEKPLRGLALVFQFFGPGRTPLTTQKAVVEEESLGKGEESAIHAQLNDPVRAVSFEISAVDEAGRDLNVAKPGPYPIE